MHHSRLSAILIDCRTDDLQQAARFWAQALGRTAEILPPHSTDHYVRLEGSAQEPLVQVQRVSHESRVHLDIETDDIPAEVARLEALGAQVAERFERWVVMQAPTGQRFCVVRIQRPEFSETSNRWE